MVLGTFFGRRGSRFPSFSARCRRDGSFAAWRRRCGSWLGRWARRGRRADGGGTAASVLTLDGDGAFSTGWFAWRRALDGDAALLAAVARVRVHVLLEAAPARHRLRLRADLAHAFLHHAISFLFRNMLFALLAGFGVNFRRTFATCSWMCAAAAVLCGARRCAVLALSLRQHHARFAFWDFPAAAFVDARVLLKALGLRRRRKRRT